MTNKQFGITVFSVAFGITCFIWGILMGVIAKDLGEEKARLEQDLIDYKWQLEQVSYICGGIDEK